MLKDDTDTLAADSEKKVSSDSLAEAQAAVQSIDDALTEGIAIYSS